MCSFSSEPSVLVFDSFLHIELVSFSEIVSLPTELRNEHSEITDKINVNIQILHSVRRPTSRASGMTWTLSSKLHVSIFGSVTLTIKCLPIL